MEGKINSKPTVSGTLSGGGGGSSDHKRLYNRDAENQHPIKAITGLQDALAEKVEYSDLREIKEQLADKKAKGLYYDLDKKFSRKSFWYLTSEVDELTNAGDPGPNGEYIVSGPYDLGQGGSGGGGGGVTTVTLLNKDPVTGENYWPSAIAVGSEKVSLKVTWSSLRDGDLTGNGTMYVYVNDTLISKKSVKQGDYEIDVAEYLIAGSNKIEFRVIDTYSTVKNLIGNINAVTLRLTSTFEDDVIYKGPITYTYTPIGDVDKTVYFIIDGVEVGHEVVKSTGDQCIRLLPSQSHGAHTLEVYFSAEIDGDLAYSNYLKYDLICTVAGNSTPIIASTFPAESDLEQYVSTNIRYRVYTPGANDSEVLLIVDGQQLGDPLIADLEWQNWEIRPTVTGAHTYTIQTGTVSRVFNIQVSKSTIDVNPESGAVLTLDTFGRSNSESLDVRSTWKDEAHDISCLLTGFNWVSNGWVLDNEDTSNASTVLRLSGAARVTIPFKPFDSDILGTGKTIEIEFATSDVKDYEARILECLTGGDSLTYSTALAGEDDRSHYYVVNNVDMTKFIEAVRGEHRVYLFLYDGTSWTLDGEAVPTEDLSNIYGIDISLVDREGTPSDYFINGDRITVSYLVVGRGIYITPQLARFQSQLTSLQTQYKENERVKLTFVIEPRNSNRLIYMYINGIMSGVSRYPSSDVFNQEAYISLGNDAATLDIYNIRIYNKSLNRKQVVNNWIADMKDPVTKAIYYQDNDNFDETGKVVISKIPSKTPYMVIKSPTLPTAKKDRKIVETSFTYPGSESRDFTSTGTQIDVQGTSSQYYYKKNFKLNFKEGFIDSEGEPFEKYKINPPVSKKEKKFTLKADVASSEGANNVELVRYFEFTKHWNMPAELDQDPDDTADELNTKDRIRTGIDGFPMILFHDNTVDQTPVFYGKMNFNNDKDNKNTFGFSEGDECWEFINNTTPLALFQSDDLRYWDSSFESRYPEEYGDDDHIYGTQPGELDKLQRVLTWVASTRRLPTDSEEEKQRKLDKFKTELPSYFNVQSSLFYYLYTELFLMVDSRAKNAMLAYLRSHKSGDGGGRWFWLPYDMDTAIGTNNEGLLVFNYDAEDTDTINGANVYNGQDSVFWCNLRDAYQTELKDLYASLRSGNAGGEMSWSYDNIENLFEKHQAYWSASIFNEDSYVKYLEPLINNNDATYLGMAQGSKEEQRKWWLWNRFRYLDSKYKAQDAKTNSIMMRAYAKDNFEITPYINCYITAVFDQDKDDLMVTIDGQRNTKHIMVPPEHWDPAAVDSVVAIYSADLIQDIGDISGFKPGYADFSKATKLQRLQVGSARDGYSNNNLTQLNVGANHLLTYLDARNCAALGTGTKPGDTNIIDLEKCTSIEEVYFDNTNILGAVFPVGGNLRKVHLPASITDLTIRNHPNLTELVLAGTSHLSSVWLEDIPSSSISAEFIINAMTIGSGSTPSVRLIGIDETIDNLETLQHLYEKLALMKGKNNKGDEVPISEAITGVIHIPQSVSVPYAEWRRLTNMFPNVRIDARVICTVTFINDGEEYEVRNVVSGGNIDAPVNPTKSSNEQYYYTFNRWDKAFTNVKTDLEINAIYDAHIQHYTIKYNVRSDIIQVEEDTFDVQYGGLLPQPIIIEDTIPAGVNFLGWYTANNDKVNFGTDTVIGNIIRFPETMEIEISARWQDSTKPRVTLSRVAFNKFHFVATDNMGVSAWVIVDHECTQEELDTLDWNGLARPLTSFEGDYEINRSGDFYFYVKDDQGWTSWDKLYANSITLIQNIHNSRDNEERVQLQLTESYVVLGSFALTGTEAKVGASVDSHYDENTLELTYLGEPLLLDSNLTINSDITIYADIYPKSYRVEFFNGDLGEKPADQIIVFRHLVTTPDPQADSGKAITAWKRADGTEWIFEMVEVLEDTQLYAQWSDITDPTQINIDTTEENQTITINFTQSKPGAAQVDWGDGSPFETFSPSSDYTYASLSHTYAAVATYSLKIKRLDGNYLLGWNYDTPTISPISTVSDIIFSWDVAYTNPGAFRNATNLGTLYLTRFMTKIAASAFEGCNITKFRAVNKDGETYVTDEIPSSIKSIENRAFMDCNYLESIILPAKLTTLGGSVFNQCHSLRSVRFNKECPLTEIKEYTFNDCPLLATVVLPDTLTTIGDAAFMGCYALTSIDLAAAVTTLGERAFRACYGLESIILRATDMTIGDSCFNNCTQLQTAGPIGGDYNIQYAWTDKIPDRAFNRSSLKSIVLSDTIKEIGLFAFSDCSQLSGINEFKISEYESLNRIPEGVIAIKESAFNNCLSLTNIDLPFSINYLGAGVFNACRSLSKVYLRFASISDKVLTTSYAWFTQTPYSSIQIYVTDVLEGATPEESIINVNTAYGAQWNYHSTSTTGDYNYLSYTFFNAD